MSSTPQSNSPETRRHTDARLRRLTRAAALAATGATIAIGVVVAKEHPGASTPSKTVPARGPFDDVTTYYRGAHLIGARCPLGIDVAHHHHHIAAHDHHYHHIAAHHHEEESCRHLGGYVEVRCRP